MRIIITAILILGTLAASANTDIKNPKQEIVPQGQDRGGAPAMQKLAADTKVVVPQVKPDKLLPFYSLTHTKGHRLLKCAGMVGFQAGDKVKLKGSFPIEFACSKSNPKENCAITFVGKIPSSGNLPEAIKKLMGVTVNAGLSMYLSENRVEALAKAKKDKDGWIAETSKIKSIRVNEAMTELSVKEKNIKANLQTIEGYLFVTGTTLVKDGLKIDFKGNYEKRDSTYYPANIKIDATTQKSHFLAASIDLKECSSN